ncbi:MAG: cation diffusion facilitator family transporter [Gammaproteobacteria bacterium]|nr:cation diffusion facilitator family transporter [Gammaproteobacteria bacterium]
MTHNHRYHQAKNITLLGAGVNVVLTAIKIVGGMVFFSHALIADGLHSLSDLFTDVMVLLASKFGSQAADDGHPYGHQRIETAATLLLSLVLILTGLGIAWDSLGHILHRNVEIPNRLALPIAALSIVANEILFYMTKRVGERIKSTLVIANAWHRRSDSASSAIVVVGILGSLMGYPFLDPIAAILVGALIVKMGIGYGWDSVKELVDTGVSSEQVDAIKQVINRIDGVDKIHQLRNRKMGNDILVDVHILVSPWISVSEGHQIAQRVHYSLMHDIAQIKDVTVHVDPEDDELGSPSRHLPDRVTLEQQILQKWQQHFPQIKSYVLHYLDGMITVEIILDESLEDCSGLRAMVQDDLPQCSDINSVRLLSQQALITLD